MVRRRAILAAPGLLIGLSPARHDSPLHNSKPHTLFDTQVGVHHALM